MDPNETLKEIREYAAAASRGDDARLNERRMRWAFDELDHWLSSGGFLPKEWEARR